jgi:hypothetical protein
MSIVGIIVAIAVVGFLLWLVESFVPMPVTVKRVLEAVVILALVLWLLSVFGLLGIAAVRV